MIGSVADQGSALSRALPWSDQCWVTSRTNSGDNKMDLNHFP
jgi:hypothetical protein